MGMWFRQEDRSSALQLTVFAIVVGRGERPVINAGDTEGINKSASVNLVILNAERKIREGAIKMAQGFGRAIRGRCYQRLGRLSQFLYQAHGFLVLWSDRPVIAIHETRYPCCCCICLAHFSRN